MPRVVLYDLQERDEERYRLGLLSLFPSTLNGEQAVPHTVPLASIP